MDSLVLRKSWDLSEDRHSSSPFLFLDVCQRVEKWMLVTSLWHHLQGLPGGGRPGRISGVPDARSSCVLQTQGLVPVLTMLASVEMQLHHDSVLIIVLNVLPATSITQ